MEVDYQALTSFEPKPCPFCGARMSCRFDQQGKLNGISHPGIKSAGGCLFAGDYIGVALISGWELRSQNPLVYMQVVDNQPLFFAEADDNRTTVDFDMINRCLEYYQTKGRI